VHRYFTLALPLHARDEEESILPRLRGREPALDAELETMAREHRDHERLLATLAAACAELASDPARREELGRVAAQAAEELERHFGAHLAREETVVFPAVRRLLDRAADAAIVAEIREQRQALPGGVADGGVRLRGKPRRGPGRWCVPPGRYAGTSRTRVS
jgi:hemerythrin-like domain-containing protein